MEDTACRASDTLVDYYNMSRRRINGTSRCRGRRPRGDRPQGGSRAENVVPSTSAAEI
jgi:hypothetical protein